MDTSVNLDDIALLNEIRNEQFAKGFNLALDKALEVLGRVTHTPDEYGEPMINMITASIVIDALRKK